MKHLAYVGAYTDSLHREGIHVFECDADTGSFRTVNVVDAYANPIYMALNRKGTRLYSVFNDPKFGPPGRDGGVAAFRLNAIGERLELVNSIPTGWTTPCYLALDPDEKGLVYAEYSCGTAGYVDLGWSGALDEKCAARPGQVNPLCQVRHEGKGPNQPRQDSAHAHCAVVTPDGKFMLVVDLTLDRIVAYDYRRRREGLRAVKAASIDTGAVCPGAGPRHILFHPNGRLAFVVFELYNKVASYRYTGEGFEFVELKDLLGPGSEQSPSKAAAIKLSEDGRQLFCTNRGRDSIAVFNLDPATGRLEFLNLALLDGKFPRDFAFMPGGRFALVGLKQSWRVASYAYDRGKGTFAKVAQMEGVYRPLYFAFNPKGIQ